MEKTLLIADDNPEIVDILETYAVRDGYRVLRAGDGLAALELFHREAPALVLLDVMMPGKDGFAVCREIRATSDVPVILVTARGEDADRIMGLDIGADDYIVKPFDANELLARLRAMLRRASGRAQAVWTHGELQYDPAAKQVHWQGRPVDLTGRELALLEALLMHPQRVLSKAQLQEKLYDWSGGEPESNTLEVHVHHLRRKLPAALIRTVRGVGYALDEAVAQAPSETAP